MRRPALLFDFGGTLDADGIPWSAQFHRAFVREGIAVDPERFDATFRRSDAELARWPGISRAGYRATIEQQVRILLGMLGRDDPGTLDRIADQVTSGAIAIATRNQPLLAILGDTWRLGIVSNFTGNLEHCLAELGLAPLFSVVADSGVLGCRKPDLRIFAWTLAALDADIDGSWMIGDNFAADIRPAASIGLSTCWIAPDDRTFPDIDTGASRVSSLSYLGLALPAPCRA